MNKLIRDNGRPALATIAMSLLCAAAPVVVQAETLDFGEIEVGKTYEYSLVKGADEDGLAIQNSGQEVDPTKVGEVHGIKVDASAPGAKFDNVNRASNGDSQVTKGVVLGVPVNGKSTITIVGYQDIEIGITDKEEPAYADKETISCGGGCELRKEGG